MLFARGFRSVASTARTTCTLSHARNFSASATTRSVVVFGGDGIGPEIVNASIRAIDATGASINWIRGSNIGFETKEKTGEYVTEEQLQLVEKHGAVFKGPLTIPSGPQAYVKIRDREFTSPNQVFRKLFSLYANVRPAKTVPGVPTPFPGTNLTIVRENTEDVYTGEETYVDEDTVHGIKRITRQASNRIAKKAFDLAIAGKHMRVTTVHKANVCEKADGLFLEECRKVAAVPKYAGKHKRVTAVHKANVCKKADGLFLEECRKVAADPKYAKLKYDEHLADSLLTKLVLDPTEFDVLLCPNLYGDFISDLAGGLIGSLGLMPSGQYGEKMVVFEPTHGSAPDIAGQGIANPISQMRCGVMLLRALEEFDAAEKLDGAIVKVLNDGKKLTRDLGGLSSTEELTNEIIREIER